MVTIGRHDDARVVRSGYIIRIVVQFLNALHFGELCVLLLNTGGSDVKYPSIGRLKLHRLLTLSRFCILKKLFL